MRPVTSTQRKGTRVASPYDSNSGELDAEPIHYHWSPLLRVFMS
jgi:hypothetical protein